MCLQRENGSDCGNRELLMKSRFTCSLGLGPQDKGKGSLNERVFSERTREAYKDHEFALRLIFNLTIMPR